MEYKLSDEDEYWLAVGVNVGVPNSKVYSLSSPSGWNRGCANVVAVVSLVRGVTVSGCSGVCCIGCPSCFLPSVATVIVLAVLVFKGCLVYVGVPVTVL